MVMVRLAVRRLSEMDQSALTLLSPPISQIEDEDVEKEGMLMRKVG